MTAKSDLIYEVAQKLTELHDADGGRLTDLTYRTKAVKGALCELGSEKKYGVCAHSVDVPVDNGEYLFDVCWLRYDEGYLANVELVAECEWGNDGDIEDDFQKLMIARADLRVIVFGEKNISTKHTLENLKRHLKAFSSNGKANPSDLYLAVAHESIESGFSFFKLTGNGECEEL